MEKFEIKDFDNDSLEGWAETSYDEATTASSELDIIKKACQDKSKQMKEHYKVEYDGRPFSSQKRKLKDGSTITNIGFGFEVKTKE